MRKRFVREPAPEPTTTMQDGLMFSVQLPQRRIHLVAAMLIKPEHSGEGFFVPIWLMDWTGLLLYEVLRTCLSVRDIILSPGYISSQSELLPTTSKCP